METHNPGATRTLQHALSQPFEPLTLRRPMTLFPTSLGLESLKPGLPSDDFLANFQSGRLTYLAMVRRGFGKEFRNFQNYARPDVETSPEVRERLLQAVGGKEDLLEYLATSMREGELIAELAQTTRVAEGVLYQFMRTISSGSYKCIHCNAEMVSRPAKWWAKQPCTLGEAEHRFVDRILYDSIAVTLLPLVFQANWAHRRHAIDHLAALCAPGAHPFGHWLNLVRRTRRAKDLATLAKVAVMTRASPDNHLQRVARGDMLTPETIEEVTAGMQQDPRPLRKLGMHVRVLAFAIDFLVAADDSPDPLSWSAAQAIVEARIRRLGCDLLLSFARRASPPQAADEAAA